jgi:hypothetical protein
LCSRISIAARRNCKGLRYPSDLNHADRRLVELMIPLAKRGGRKRSVDAREALNGIHCAYLPGFTGPL